ncbi:unnamed protein product [Allacma fusca]|uniref:Uncharacterized protein n=1 Tax=Allacma fusca TaxID=39272 RepID=A0A8J2NJ02_9HEXA|nr:unnamed protein product [Allacma fusca]
MKIWFKEESFRVTRYSRAFTIVGMDYFGLIEVANGRIFIARRGKPLEIYSDNGTNRRGTDVELQKSIPD